MNAYICLFAGDSFHFIRFASEKETLCKLLMFWSMPPLHYQSINKAFYAHEWPETTELQISLNCTRATPTTVYPSKTTLL